LLSVPLLPPQDVRTSKAAHVIAIPSLMSGPFAELCPEDPQTRSIVDSPAGHVRNRHGRLAQRWSYVCGDGANLRVGRSVTVVAGSWADHAAQYVPD
jgi:hypothetical protein